LKLERDDVGDISLNKAEQRKGDRGQQPQSWTLAPLLHNPKPRNRVKSQRGNGGDKKANQYTDKALYVITEVRPAREILEPANLRGQFRNAIGALVRDELNLAVPTWKDVLEETKISLWEKKLMVNFRFSEGTHEWVKHAALKQMGDSF
jgi:hypothetical protein